MLTEEYRPDSIDETIGQNHIRPKLKEYVERGEIPHLMFAGDPGLGKTTLAIAIAKEVYGEHWQRDFLELNASDERGIDVVRERIKDYAKSSFTGDGRIIFLDECDSLTDDAQSALRRTIERNSDQCRFILSCNYPAKIIDAIQSRCAIFNFEPVPDDEMIPYLKEIAEAEEMDIEDDAFEAIAQYSGGDVRRAVNSLDYLYIGETLTKEEVVKVLPIADQDDVLKLLNLCSVGEFNQALDFAEELMYEKGITARHIIDEISEVVWDTSMEDQHKARVLDLAGNADYFITEGANERVQIAALLGSVVKECGQA